MKLENARKLRNNGIYDHSFSQLRKEIEQRGYVWDLFVVSRVGDELRYACWVCDDKVNISKDYFDDVPEDAMALALLDLLGE